MQFRRLENLITRTKSKKTGEEELVTIPMSTYLAILRAAVHSSPIFDEEYYLASRPDVAEAIKSGSISSAREHYAKTGYFENLLPGNILIDEAYYLSANPDIASAFKKRHIQDLQKHFQTNGFFEGRLPSKNFSIWKKI